MTKDKFLETLYDIAEGSGTVSYTFEVPPVYTQYWTRLDWAKWIYKTGKFSFVMDGQKFFIDKIQEYPEHTKVTIYRAIDKGVEDINNPERFTKLFRDLEPQEILRAMK